MNGGLRGVAGCEMQCFEHFDSTPVGIYISFEAPFVTKYIGKQIKGELSDGDFAGAFDKFVDLCDEFITQARTGEPYDVKNLPTARPMAAEEANSDIRRLTL